MSRSEFWTRAIAIAVVSGVGLSQVILAIGDWRLDDWEIYRSAADRVLAGEPLYASGEPLRVYRYSPWLAYAAIPFSGPVWSAVMLLGSAIALIPLMRLWRRAEAAILLLLFAPILFYMSSSGNVQGPMLAVLIWSLPTRWAFVGIGLAASLKVTPIAYALVLIAERRWLQAMGAVGLALALWAPAVLMGTSAETLDPGRSQLLPTGVWIAVAVVVVVAGLAMAARRSPLTWLAAGIAAVTTLPRFFFYDSTLLLPAAAGPLVERRNADQVEDHTAQSR
jgi:hypothetical protein